MKVDMVIKNGLLVLPYGIVEAGLGIEGEKIISITRNANLPQAEKTIDAKGKYIIPGGIDVYVGTRDPGRPDQEDYKTCSEAAVVGGVTTILDKSGPNPPSSNLENLMVKVKSAEAKSVVDYGIYGGFNQPPKDISGIPELAKAGVLGFGVILAYPDFPDDAMLFKTFEEIGKTGLPATVRAENRSLIALFEERLTSQGKTDIFAHFKGRPDFCEAETISKCIIFSKAAGCRLHIHIVSSAVGSQLIRTAKANGQAVTCDTAPQYLLPFKKKDLERMGPWARFNPPIREKADIAALWQCVHDGTVDNIGTDHAPRTREEKEVGWKNIFDTGPGTIGVETLLPLMLTEVNREALSINELSSLVSQKPAEVFGLYPRKGIIQIGSDADIVIVDMKKKQTIKADKLHSKSKNTVYNGWNVKGLPILTIIRGEVVAKDGEVIAKPGFGKWIKPIK